MKQINIDLNRLTDRELKAYMILKEAEERQRIHHRPTTAHVNHQNVQLQYENQPVTVPKPPLPQFNKPLEAPSYQPPKKEQKKGLFSRLKKS